MKNIILKPAFRAACMAILLLITCPGETRAIAEAEAASRASELQVKAAYLFNFSLFVEWPPGSFENITSDINVCVLGEDPFGPVLDTTFRNHQLNGRKFSIIRSKWPQDLSGCHILYAGTSATRGYQLKAFSGKPVLTVGEAPGMPANGAIINFFTEESHIRFEINLPLARKNGLFISSRMLQVGKVITEEPGGNR